MIFCNECSPSILTCCIRFIEIVFVVFDFSLELTLKISELDSSVIRAPWHVEQHTPCTSFDYINILFNAVRFFFNSTKAPLT